MKKPIIFLFSGLFLGMFLTVAGLGFIAPKIMLDVQESRLNFDDTLAAIKASAKEEGWKTPKAYDLQKTFAKAGYGEMSKMTVLSLCQPHHAAALLSEDSQKPFMAMMPCRVGIYEAADGKVYLSQMNMGLLSRLIGGDVAKIMKTAAQEENEIFAHVLVEKVDSTVQ